MHSFHVPMFSVAVAVAVLAGCGTKATTSGAGGAGGAASSSATTDASTSTGSTASSSASTGAGTPTTEIHFAGRFDTSGQNPRFTWPGSAISTRFNGTKISVTLSDTGKNEFEVIVDGTLGMPLSETGMGTYELATGLTSGMHDLEIVRRSESFFGVTTFESFTTDGSLVKTPSPFLHKIEFVGDSMTCGYGVEGMQGCTFSEGTETAYKAYADITAHALSAEPHIVAWSGKGVYQNYGGNMTELMPELYLRTIATDANSHWDFTSWTPDAVVIFLGANDHSAPLPAGAFAGAYAAFLTKIRGHYPNAAIFCVGGTILASGATAEIQQAMTMANVGATLVQFPFPPASDGQGCDGHPSAITQNKYATILTQAMKTKLGW